MSLFAKVSKDKYGNEKKEVYIGRIVGTVLGALTLLTLFFGSFSTVGPGQRGVLVTFGSPSDTVLDSGLHLKLPLVSELVTISVRVNRSDVETGSASKDMQEITTHVAINWSISADQVVKTYKTLGDEGEILKRVISPAVSEVLKAEMAKLTAEEILTKRLELKKSIDKGLYERLAGYGVHLADLSIVNLTFSPDFTKAIEQKQIAEQKAKQAEYDAQRAVKEADAELNRAHGKSEAQKLMRSTITKEILSQQAIEKWDGKFPQVMGSGALPFLNLNLNHKAE